MTGREDHFRDGRLGAQKAQTQRIQETRLLGGVVRIA